MANIIYAGGGGGLSSTEILNVVYPVGSLYWSVNPTNPSSLFGGSWEQIKDKFVLAVGDTYKIGSSGGEATHVLTVNEMPSHNHAQREVSADKNINVHVNNHKAGRTTGTTWLNHDCDGWVTNKQVVETINTGGSQAHNNMPPYMTAYCWKRIG